MELKITKEKVLEAAKSCPNAKEVLNKLFPECFENNVNNEIDLSKLTLIDENLIGNGKYWFIDSRFKNAFWLNDSYFNWELKMDNNGYLLLIPTKK